MKTVTMYQDNKGVNHATKDEAVKADIRYMMEQASGNVGVAATVSDWLIVNAEQVIDALRPLISAKVIYRPSDIRSLCELGAIR